jgi:hypothetical protein
MRTITSSKEKFMSRKFTTRPVLPRKARKQRPSVYASCGSPIVVGATCCVYSQNVNARVIEIKSPSHIILEVVEHGDVGSIISAEADDLDCELLERPAKKLAKGKKSRLHTVHGEPIEVGDEYWSDSLDEVVAVVRLIEGDLVEVKPLHAIGYNTYTVRSCDLDFLEDEGPYDDEDDEDESTTLECDRYEGASVKFELTDDPSKVAAVTRIGGVSITLRVGGVAITTTMSVSQYARMLMGEEIHGLRSDVGPDIF